MFTLASTYMYMTEMLWELWLYDTTAHVNTHVSQTLAHKGHHILNVIHSCTIFPQNPQCWPVDPGTYIARVSVTRRTLSMPLMAAGLTVAR